VKRMLYSIFFVLLVSSASAQSLSVPSTWVNQRQSVLTVLFIDPSGKFQGTYVNNAAGTQCRGFPYGVEGNGNGPNVSFVVTFTPCNTVTVWRGQVMGSTLTTAFEAAYPSRGHVQIWRGADSFTRR
jgi:hypothetical protein